MIIISRMTFELGDDLINYVDAEGNVLASVKMKLRWPTRRHRKTSLSASDKLAIAEFAAVIGFTPAAVIAAIESYRSTAKKDYYSIPGLATRWCMSRSGVYNVLRDHEAKIVDFTGNGKDRGKKVVYADVVERIEKQRTRLIA
jgi:hypothetical protein